MSDAAGGPAAAEPGGGGAGRVPMPLVLRLASEFAVIVLGVLVALGIEGWFADRDEAAREVELLQSLATDLVASLAVLEEDNAEHLERVDVLEWFLRLPVEEGASVREDSISVVTWAANYTEAYYPTLRTYETMIATGTFDLVSSAEIRLALADMRVASQFYSDYRNQATQQWNDTFSTTWLEHMGVHRLPDWPDSPVAMPGAPFADAVEAALRDDYFRAVIDRRRIFLWYVAANGTRLVETMRTALDLIDDELAARGAARS